MHLRAGPRERWWPWLTLWTLVGLGIRLATVYGRPHRVAGGDAYFYYNAAKLLVAGQGFINPYYYYPHHQHLHVQSASFPPLFIFLLAVPSALGFKSFLAARIWCCILGAAAVVAVGYAGKEIGGRRVGLLAAFLLAIYPNIWMSDELALSEALDPLLVAVVLLCAYRFWKRPDVVRALILGGSLGLAMLGRDELSLLVVFILLPLALLARTLSWRRRFGLLGIGVLTAALLVAPWVGYNMSRFDKPVFISNGLGVTLASADCNTTFSGQFEGYWSMKCALAAPIKPNVDESVQGAEAQAYAVKYLKAHEGRLLPVSLAKVGRAFGFFHPMQQLQFDYYIETRPYHWAIVGLCSYYVLLALSLGGTVVLRRRKIPSFPLWAVGLDVVLSVVLTFGQTRYRTAFEVCLVILASVQLEWFWQKLRPRRRGAAPAVTPPGDDPPVPALVGATGSGG